MHQTKKGNQWYFGMKLHIGADSQTGLVHSASVTAANVHDSHEVPNLLHGEETRFYGDSAYRGKQQRERLKDIAPKAKDFTNKRAYRNCPLTEADKETNRRKSSVRSKVEHYGLAGQTRRVVALPRRTSMTATKYRSCCMAKKPASTATAPTGAKINVSGSRESRPRRRTSPTSAPTETAL
jgi:IS5 family transposase